MTPDLNPNLLDLAIGLLILASLMQAALWCEVEPKQEPDWIRDRDDAQDHDDDSFHEV